MAEYTTQSIYDQFGLNTDNSKHIALVKRYQDMQEELKKGEEAINKSKEELAKEEKIDWLYNNTDKKNNLAQEINMLQDAQRTTQEQFDTLRIDMQIAGHQYNVSEWKKDIENINKQLEDVEKLKQSEVTTKIKQELLQEKEALASKINKSSDEIEKLEAVQKAKDLFNKYERISTELYEQAKALPEAKRVHDEAQKKYDEMDKSIFRNITMYRKPIAERAIETWDQYCDVSNKAKYLYEDLEKMMPELQEALDKVKELDKDMLQFDGLSDAVRQLNPTKWHDAQNMDQQTIAIDNWRKQTNELSAQFASIVANDSQELNIQDLTQVIAGVVGKTVQEINLDVLTRVAQNQENLVPIKDIDEQNLVPIKDIHDNLVPIKDIDDGLVEIENIGERR